MLRLGGWYMFALCPNCLSVLFMEPPLAWATATRTATATVANAPPWRPIRATRRLSSAGVLAPESSVTKLSKGSNTMSDTKRKPASILKEFAAEMKRLFERVKE